MLETIEVPTVSTYYKYIQLLPRIFHKNQGAFANLFKMKYKKQAVEDGKFPFFKDLLLRKDSLNVLTSRTSFSTSEKIKLVTRVLQGNIIKFNRQFFKAQKGVPQGFSCSPYLSNLYYSCIEQEISDFISQKYSTELVLIIRLHDDYLILTSNAGVLNEIIENMERVAKTHNFYFATDKIHTNLPGP